MESPKIKNLYFKIGDYKLRNELPEDLHNDDYFIGREKIISRLKFILTDSKTENGAYLVTGYRGMGKTSTVMRAIKNVKNKNIIAFPLSLSQDHVKELDLLRQISWKLNEYIENRIHDKLEKNNLQQVLSFVSFILALGAALGIINSPPPPWDCPVFINPFLLNSSGSIFLFFALFAFIFSSILLLISYLIKKNKSKNSYQRKIEEIILTNYELKNRLLSSYEQKDNIQSSFNIGAGNPISHLANFFLNKLQKNENKKVGTNFYEKATTKEIEQYLSKILNDLKELRNEYSNDDIPNFIFIIDELDKIEPDYPESVYPVSTGTIQTSTSRKRNRVIINLLANLKSFLNTANAKFIFIGGRDMYDAYLADIADRESFYSSIFKEVIYVESFFKDKLSNGGGLTQVAESYLCSLLDNKKTTNKAYPLRKYIKSLKIEDKAADNETNTRIKFKIAHTLQNYILFLTYRCNGSPKKLIELIESNIVCLKKKDNELKNGQIITQKIEGDKYLKLGYQTQYEINLHSNIYRPYTIKNSQHQKSNSDKLLYTTAYLFDHLLKFHNNAFSWDNLERLPDLVLTNNDPNFRAFYSEILNFLTHQHLRKTTNAVFQYKFNSKIANEIRVCSKLSEQSSAGFNFTLDESLQIKNFYYDKLKQIQNEDYKSYFQKMYLHSILGDLSFNDGDYDNAIIHYSKACLPLKKQFENEHTFALEIKNSIVLGLCFEKNKMFNQSLSVYKAVKEECKNLPEYYDRKKQIFQRPFIAELGIFEKDRQSGITYNNLTENFIEYYNFLLNEKTENHTNYYNRIFKKELQTNIFPIGKHNFSEGKDLRITTLIADYYFSVGNILYFRNNKYPELHLNNIFAKDNKFNAASYYYSFALSTFIEQYPKSCRVEDNTLLNALYQLSDELELLEWELNNEQFDFLGNILTKLGDSILSSIKNKPNEKELFEIKKVLNAFCSSVIDHTNKHAIQFNDTNGIIPVEISSVLKIYRLAYLCYKKSGKLYSAIYQYKKVLYILLDSIREKENYKFLTAPNYNSSFLDKNYSNQIISKNNYLSKKINKLLHIPNSILDQMTTICLNAQSEITEISNRRQITKYRKQLKTKDNTKILFSNLSTSPDVKEYIYLNQTIKIKLGASVSDIYIGEYSTVSSMFTRVAELKYVGDKYKKDLTVLNGISEAVIKKLKRKDSDKTVLAVKKSIVIKDENLKNEYIKKIAYSFFAYSEILRIISIYGLNYILNHSFKAAICERLAEICALIELLSDDKSLKKELENISGKSYYKFVDDLEYVHLAKYHYEAAISLHNGGVQYSELTKEMYFLNDDFNDNLTHFCAATERYRINTGKISEKLIKLEEYLSHSKLANLKNYF